MDADSQPTIFSHRVQISTSFATGNRTYYRTATRSPWSNSDPLTIELVVESVEVTFANGTFVSFEGTIDGMTGSGSVSARVEPSAIREAITEGNPEVLNSVVFQLEAKVTELNHENFPVTAKVQVTPWWNVLLRIPQNTSVDCTPICQSRVPLLPITSLGRMDKISFEARFMCLWNGGGEPNMVVLEPVSSITVWRRPSHSAFLIPHVAASIVEITAESQMSEVTPLSRVCKSLGEAVFDYTWRTMSGHLRPLWSLLSPCGVEVTSQGGTQCLVVPRELFVRDFDRFSFYAQRVRRIIQPRLPNTTIPSFQRLQRGLERSHSKDLRLFPSLREFRGDIQFAHQDETWRALQSGWFTSSALDNFELKLIATPGALPLVPREAVAEILLGLPGTLQCLSLHVMEKVQREGAFASEMEKFLDLARSLEIISLGSSFQGVQVLRKILQLPLLRSIDVSTWHIPSFAEAINQSTESAVTSLDAAACTGYSILKALGPETALQWVAIIGTSKPALDDHEEPSMSLMCAEIGRFRGTLESISIDLDVNRTSTETSPLAIAALSLCPRLETLRLTGFSPPTDDNIRHLAANWPALKTLQWIPPQEVPADATADSHNTYTATLVGLSELSHRCPHLYILSIPIIATNYAPSSPPNRLQNMTSLGVQGWSIRPSRPADLARFLHALGVHQGHMIDSLFDEAGELRQDMMHWEAPLSILNSFAT